MKIKDSFEIVKIADDSMIVPIGDMMDKFNGVVVLNETSEFILKSLKTDRALNELVSLVVNEFDVEYEIAFKDVELAVDKMKRIGIVND